MSLRECIQGKIERVHIKKKKGVYILGQIYSTFKDYNNRRSTQEWNGNCLFFAFRNSIF